MKTRQARPGEINYDLVDRFTLVHGAVGFVLGAANVPMPYVLLAAIGWEIAERPLKEAHPSLFPRRSQDSLQNAVGDAVAMTLGYLIQQKLWDAFDARSPARGTGASLSGAVRTPYTLGT